MVLFVEWIEIINLMRLQLHFIIMNLLRLELHCVYYDWTVIKILVLIYRGSILRT